MKNGILLRHVLAFIGLSFGLTPCLIGQSSTDQKNKGKTIVAVGSSVASGWVTSHTEKYDMQNGYLARLARDLQPAGWTVINKSVPGFNTRQTYELLVEEVIPLKPDYVYIGLSMSNEGLETEDPDSVYSVYRKGLRWIIDQCIDSGAQPVIGLCYPNDNYTPLQYAYVKKMNQDIAQWGYPCINLLGALDDGHGHFPAGYTFDSDHPDNQGHEELFLAFPDGFFQTLAESGYLPLEWKKTDGCSLGLKARNQRITYFSGSLTHSFTLTFECKSARSGQIAEIQSITGNHKISVTPSGSILYQSEAGQAASVNLPDQNKWHHIAISHSYLNNLTRLFVDGIYQAAVTENLEITDFSLGLHPAEARYRNLLFYRASLTPDEVALISSGKVFEPSLGLACTLGAGSGVEPDAFKNQALSQASLQIDPVDLAEKRAKTTLTITEAATVRANELCIPPKKPIQLDPSVYVQYAGKYEIGPGDYFEVIVRENKIFFADRGNEAELFPESANSFFIQYPADLTVTFIAENNVVSGLVFGMNGKEMKAKKVQ